MKFLRQAHWELWSLNVMLGKDIRDDRWLFGITLGPFSVGVQW